jgi:hypothetical protein
MHFPFGWYLLFQEIQKQICKECTLTFKQQPSVLAFDSVMVKNKQQCFNMTRIFRLASAVDLKMEADPVTGTSCPSDISVH